MSNGDMSNSTDDEIMEIFRRSLEKIHRECDCKDDAFGKSVYRIFLGDQEGTLKRGGKNG